MKACVVTKGMFVYFVYAFLLLFAYTGYSQENDSQKSLVDIYGFIMTDIGYNFGQSDPDWFDVVRPTKLSTYENQYETDDNVYFGVRQTRFGFEDNSETKLGHLKLFFEMDLYGTGPDASQTTFHLRHAYGELGNFGVGKYWSPFMDIDAFPNSLDYWGPCALVCFQNIQIRYMPIQGDNRLTFALEQPGATADRGVYGTYSELEDVSFRFPLPDFSAEYHRAFSFGYIEIAGIIRRVEWKDNGTDDYDLSGDMWGWGLNLTSYICFGNNNIHFQGVVGKGIQNYVNDGGSDIGIDYNQGNSISPIKGVALPITGGSLFFEHQWNVKFSSCIGYSMVDIDNAEAQSSDAYKQGRYGLANLIYSPMDRVLMGCELQYGGRDNKSDGWSDDIFKIQFSFKYSFAQKIRY